MEKLSETAFLADPSFFADGHNQYSDFSVDQILMARALNASSHFF
jgi:hypothetical protein